MGIDVLEIGRWIVCGYLFGLERVDPVPEFLVAEVAINIVFVVEHLLIILGVIHLALELELWINVILVVSIFVL